MNKNREQAIEMRKCGCSYNEIIRKVKVSKGTLSYWFKGIKEFDLIKKNNIATAKDKWKENITKYNKNRSVIAREKWKMTQLSAQKDIKGLNLRELWLVGIALYWAEGYKRGNWNVIFCNADPDTNKLMMQFFLRICKVPVEKIRAQIQIHDNISEGKALGFWSKAVSLPKSQFLKSISQKNKASKGVRKNNCPYGTLRLRVNDVVLLNKIKGWISGLSMGLEKFTAI